MKQCSECGEEKDLSSFARRKSRKDGHISVCDDCRVMADPNVLRKCSKCGEEKPLTEYFKRKETADGYRRDCKACCAVRNTPATARYRERFPEKTAEANRVSVAKWKREHPDRARATYEKDYERHRDRYYVHNRKRRARLQEAETLEISEKDLRRIMSQPCAHCGEPSEHLDHVIPLARGGRHSVGNLQGLCGACNSGKRDRLEIEVRKRRIND